MHKAGRKANELGHPVVLDPVGAGASVLRTQTAKDLIESVKFAVIRGNISEIKALALGEGGARGVDADVADKVTKENLAKAVSFAKEFAGKTGAVIAITGAIDIVADGEKAYCIYNGHPMMSSITGTGCQLSAITAAYVTANPETPLEAAAAAVCLMGVCGEKAYERLTEYDALIKQEIDNGDIEILSYANAYSDGKLSVAQKYTDDAVAQKSQVQFVIWVADD
jgi:hydroxyethylthiazole kinase